MPYILLVVLFWAIIFTIMVARVINRFQPLPPIDDPTDNNEYKKRDVLEQELNDLYYELDLLKKLSTIQERETAYNDMTESQIIKQALRNEKAIHATLKKIRNIEYKLERLDE